MHPLRLMELRLSAKSGAETSPVHQNAETSRITRPASLARNSIQLAQCLQSLIVATVVSKFKTLVTQ
eukprot:3014325-Amphidinium_carterae.1